MSDAAPPSTRHRSRARPSVGARQKIAKFSFTVPIYEVAVKVTVAPTILDLIKQLDKEETGDTKPRGYTHMDWPVARILFECKALNHNTIAHEIDHLTHLIMRGIGVKECDESDEAYAYMNGYLTARIMRWINANYKLEQ